MGPRKSSTGPPAKRAYTNPSSSAPPSSVPTGSRSSVAPPAGMIVVHKDRFREFAEKNVIKRHSVINWDVLAEFDLKPVMQRLLGNGPWLKLFTIKEKAYR